MVSTKDLKPGELILKESPTVVGPKMDSQILCLGCHRLLNKSNYKLCSKCKVAPLCNADCESKPAHAAAECNFYQKLFSCGIQDNFIVSNFQLVTPLRCFMLKIFSTESWDIFIKLESHLNERQNKDIWNFYEEKIVKIMQSIGITEENMLIQKICAILDINSFELRGPTHTNLPHTERLRGIYTQAALMSHDCVGNTHLSVDDSNLMTIHASVPIKAGEPILFNYASPLETTLQRQERLKEGKYFTCSCLRCNDPTELGTYMGSIICSRCHEGNVISAKPIVKNTSWFCEKCQHKFHERLINTTLMIGWSLIEDIDGREHRTLEALLKKCLKTFPDTNIIIIEIKQKLVACYRDIILTEPNPSRQILRRKINLCQELLELLNKIEPGISRLRGITIYELYKPKFILANKEYDAGEIKAKELYTKMSECETHLKEAISILVYEPKNSPEGRLLQVALCELKTLREEINNINLLCESESEKVVNRKHRKGKKLK